MSVPQTLKQWVVEGRDGFDSLKLREDVPMPKLGDKDVLVKIHAVSLNYRDLIIPKLGQLLTPVLKGRYPFPLSDTVVPCSDGAGTVVATGPRVTRFNMGDKVATLFNQAHLAGSIDAAGLQSGLGGVLDGTLRQYGAFDEQGLVKIPSNLNWLEASTLTCAGLTAWNALYGLESRALKPGQTVLTQGTGGVSVWAVQMQKLKQLGADHVINYKENPNWGEIAKSLTPNGAGVEHVVDVCGPTTAGQSLKAIKVDGVISIIGFVGGMSKETPTLLDSLSSLCTVRGLLVGSRLQMEDMNLAIEANKIQPVVDGKVFKLEEAKDAYQYMWEQKHFGKLIRVFDFVTSQFFQALCGAMDDLASLELLSLVSKVASELQNHLGLNDTTLAEFVIDKHLKCKSLSGFKKALDELGAEFPQSLVESIDRLVLTMHPKYKTNGNLLQPWAEQEPEDERDRKRRVFRGLAIPDKERTWSAGTEPPELDPADRSGKADALDDTFAMLEGLAGNRTVKSAHTDSARKRSLSPFDDESRAGGKKRHRYRSRSRSRSPRRKDYSSKNSNYIFQDEFGRTRTRPSQEYPSSRKDKSNRHNDDQFRRPPTPELDDEPVQYKVYIGRVTGIKEYGVFVNLVGVKGNRDGLVHVSAMQEGARVNHPGDLVIRNQEVKVKVMKIENSKISLSMKEVDQTTGRDLAPHKRIASGANMEGLGGMNNGRYGNLSSGVPVIEENGGNLGARQRKRMTSPERWEIKQLIASGAISAQDYPDIDEDYNASLNANGQIEEEEDVDIEVREEEPPFLAGQTKQSLELSPIRVVKAPDGSLNRAAMSGETLAKERRDLRQQEAQDRAAQEATKVDLSAQWQDPMVAPEDRKFASELRSAKPDRTNETVPEWKRITQGKEQTGKRTTMSIKEQRESLPVFKFRKQLLEAVREHQLLIVVGDTGSGKTTQLTQYFAEDGFANNGIIGCTQPRRVAAMSVAQRVAEEVGCRLGQEVGYTIRFEDCTSPATRIKYMTDGIMQREILLDPELSKYSVIMLDEAHERTIATDVLFGLLKKALRRRPDLKLIVTSATLDADKFSEYFNKCPIFSIPGRTFPVEIMYSREPESDYLDAALVTVMQIHLTEPPGDILLFLTGKEEIDTSCEILYERMKALGPSVPELIILPIYGALPSEVASRIFEPAPPGSRKVVIATNIAETSITIDGIYYVVDPGFVKQTAYDAKLGMDRLQVTPISQAQAKQRAGRAGRTGPGKCFRLYTEAAFQSEMLPSTIPDIQRQNLSNTILMLKAMGINDLLHFDFMDPPPTNTMLTALEELYALSALDDEGLLTRLGRQMADFPMEPALAKSLIMSVAFNCSEELLTIVAMISAVQTVFHRPKDKQQQADQKKAKFHDPNGDHLTLLNVYNGWKMSNFSVPWCYENFVQPRSCVYLVETTKEYMHNVTSIEPKWLVEAAPTFFKVAPTDRLSKRKKAERIQPLHNRFAGEDDWRLSAQRRQGRGGGGTWG
ncbi:P-loop containing nucleoside triphosphate hydrolase protein [Lineolata rhizophorae]|uniref:RNA helicase n=1 Tax=Lineolata rhizophorae TaxID=578093 RepID=A0A6A6P5P1_9PEZI|nr:P-loop containing nucleoside triphosphate hydrolase protein [Lineolata rhizophorae]